jgi:hypothetical protein
VVPHDLLGDLVGLLVGDVEQLLDAHRLHNTTQHTTHSIRTHYMPAFASTNECVCVLYLGVAVVQVLKQRLLAVPIGNTDTTGTGESQALYKVGMCHVSVREGVVPGVDHLELACRGLALVRHRGDVGHVRGHLTHTTQQTDLRSHTHEARSFSERMFMSVPTFMKRSPACSMNVSSDSTLTNSHIRQTLDKARSCRVSARSGLWCWS